MFSHYPSHLLKRSPFPSILNPQSSILATSSEPPFRVENPPFPVVLLRNGYFLSFKSAKIQILLFFSSSEALKSRNGPRRASKKFPNQNFTTSELFRETRISYRAPPRPSGLPKSCNWSRRRTRKDQNPVRGTSEALRSAKIQISVLPSFSELPEFRTERFQDIQKRQNFASGTFKRPQPRSNFVTGTLRLPRRGRASLMGTAGSSKTVRNC
jgi:hypothetical protein